VLVVIDRRRLQRLEPALITDPRRMDRPGSILAVYVLGYGLGRLWIEALRIDTASLLLGLRVNIWMSMVLIVAGGLYLLIIRGRAQRKSGRDPVIPL